MRNAIISRERIKVIMFLFMTSLMLLMWAGSAAKAQEAIDPWYGQSMSELLISIQYHKEEYKIDTVSSDKVMITMIDFRGVPCEYISLNGGRTISYRVDIYTKDEYIKRKEYIHRTWKRRDDEYILNDQVVASFDDKNYRIGFIPMYVTEKQQTDSVINM